MPSYRGGYKSITVSGPIGTSGKPIRLFWMTVLSNGTAGSVISLYNNTTNTGNELIDFTGTTSKSTPVPNIPTEGLLFPNGLFVQADANMVQVNAGYEQVIT